MSKKLLCHFLIGIPGSGKSTFATKLAELLPNCVIISTDRIRQQLYCAEIIQGKWEEIESEAIAQIATNVASNRDIIYDATNAKLSYRLAMVQKMAHFNLELIAWYLDTEIEICKQRNRNRDRQVPEVVIDSMVESLKLFPPRASEGFTFVNHLNYSEKELDLQPLIEKYSNDLSSEKT